MFMKYSIVTRIYTEILINQAVDNFTSSRFRESRIKGVQISILLLNEHNISFSGGEQQKLSLVRCFIKNPSVMILDEPTSAFDAGSVEAFADLINEYKKSRIVIITHDEALIEKIDGESINLDTI